MLSKWVHTDKSTSGMIMNWMFFIWTLLVLSSCSTGPKALGAGVVYQEPKVEHCNADTLNAYHILVPESVGPTQKLPLVIVLDAHGSGALAVGKFRDAVTGFPCLVAGSDLIENNFRGYEQAIIEMIRDVELKYPVDARNIILAGFSGGARMAYSFSLKYQVKGLLMCGAGPGRQMPSCPVYMIAGMGDFNFAEQYVRPEITSLNEQQKTSAFFHGMHEWPEAGQLEDALLILLRDQANMEALRQSRTRELLHSADSLAEKGDQLMAWQSLEKAAKIAVSESDQERVVKRANERLKNKDFQQAIRALENNLRAEQKMQHAYVQAMATKDFSWWKKELTLLNEKLTAHSSSVETDHYLRIKGFIGILFYSRINSLIHSDPGDPHLESMLKSYAFAEPENPDPYYFKALYARLNGDRKTCVENRNKAVELGFSDQEKLKEIAF